ncbi:MAG: EpsG family protein [Balneolaceae bacterium]
MFRAQKISSNTDNKHFSKAAAYAIFLVWPFFALLAAIKSYRKNWAKNIVWAFTFFYGMTFIILADSLADSVRYAEQLEIMHKGGWTLPYFISQLFAIGGFEDIYQPLLTFIVSRFTDNYSVLFAIFGFVLGYFYSRNVWYLIDYSKKKIGLAAILLILVFAFTIHIGFGINGVRMWTASHIFIFGLFKYLLEQKKSGLWFICSTFLVHFSFIAPIVIFLSYLFMGNKVYIYFGIVVLSLFINQLDFELGRSLLSFLPNIYSEAANPYVSYATEERVLSSSSGDDPWFYVWGRLLFKWSILIMGSYILFYQKAIFNNERIKSLFSFGLLLYGIFNILSYFPSVGRFLSIANMLLLAVYILLLCNLNDKKYNMLILLLSPGLLLFLAFQVRMFLEYPSYLMVLGNPFIVPFVEVETNIYSIIRSII